MAGLPTLRQRLEETAAGSRTRQQGGKGARTSMPGSQAGKTPGVYTDPALQAESESLIASEKARRTLQNEQEQAERQRKRGRMATLMTGASGLLESPSVSRRTLLGL